MVGGLFTFKVIKNSSLYNNYFRAHKERVKLHSHAMKFFEETGLTSELRYYSSDFLGVELTPEEVIQYKKQLRKGVDKNGLYTFKKNSPMSKKWQEDVVSKVNIESLRCNDFWAFGFFRGTASYNLWHYKEDLYGIISGADISLSNNVTQIKASEYYGVVERIQEDSK